MKPFLLPTFLFPSLHGNHEKLQWSHPTPNTVTTQCHYRRHYRYSVVLRRMANDPFYGLTDDGDFAILGVNVEEETSDTTSEGDGQLIGLSGLLSSTMSETSFSGISNEEMNKPTVPSTAGASMNTPTAMGGVGDGMSLNDALFGRLPSNNSDMLSGNTEDAATMGVVPPSLEDTFFGRVLQNNNMVSSDVNDMTNNSDVAKPLEDSVGGSDTGKSKYPNNDEDEKSLKAWLLATIPKLNQHDLEAYSRELGEIGFHPECVTMCELKYEDLDFMKVLHRRYLFNEVSGIEHPWEA
mmetsp:Transcript_18810/g.40943  ORF Transcript_18810/g.40943 Transcript_18810/m.40943 type:complete len:295 (-) Transcript_18810:101-985(-)